MRYSCDKIILTLVVVHYKFLLSLINIRSWMRCDLIKAASVWTDLQSVRLSPAQPRLKCWPRAPLTTTGHWPTAWGGVTVTTKNVLQTRNNHAVTVIIMMKHFWPGVVCWSNYRREYSHTGECCWYDITQPRAIVIMIRSSSSLRLLHSLMEVQSWLSSS